MPWVAWPQPMIFASEWLKLILKLVFQNAEKNERFTYIHVHKDFAFGLKTP